MRRLIRRFAGLILLSVLLAISAYLRRSEQITNADGARVHVMDGDSLRIGGRIVRIEGIDAVELGQRCASPNGVDWTCGEDARAALMTIVAQGGLACTSHGGDRYGRAIAQCRTRAVPDVGAALVAQGWAVSGDGRGNGRYREEERRAKTASLGIWRGTFQRPAEWRAAHPRDAISG